MARPQSGYLLGRASRTPPAATAAPDPLPVDGQLIKKFIQKNQLLERRLRDLEIAILHKKDEQADWVQKWLRQRCVELDSKCQFLLQRCAFLEGRISDLISTAGSRRDVSSTEDRFLALWQEECKNRAAERLLHNTELLQLENIYFELATHVQSLITQQAGVGSDS